MPDKGQGIRQPKWTGRSSLEEGGGLDLQAFLAAVPPHLLPPGPESPRGRILKAARGLFAEHGFDGTSTRAIAQEARVNQAMIHYYFGTKVRLYQQVLAHEMLGMFREVAQGLPPQLPSGETLVRFPLTVMRALRSNPIRLKLIRREIGAGAQHVRTVMRELGEFGPQGLYSLVHDLIRRGQKEDRVRSLPPEVIFRFLLASAYGLLFLDPPMEAVFGRGMEDDKAWKEQLRGQEILLRRGLIADPTEEKRG